MSTALISPLSDCRIEINEKGELIIPSDLTTTEFYEAYRRARHYKSWVRAWTKRLEEFGLESYGQEAMQSMYEQVALELGDDQTPPKELGLNPDDKSTAIITIQGISSQFGLWERKMREEIPKFSAENLTKAIEILEPIERKVREMRGLLLAKGQ